jgi:8-oxo-dGTP diphosphatase
MTQFSSGSPVARRGVVAVVTCESRFLVIRRSLYVRAPRAYCFPGGGIEPGESEEVALRREMYEELSANIRVGHRLWENQTPSGVQLAWWRVALDEGSPLIANPREVESIHWLAADELRQVPGLLPTNHQFLSALARCEFVLDP